MAKATVRLTRLNQSTSGTIGMLEVDGKFACMCFELPWKSNKREVSCIPPGNYDLAYKDSPRFKRRLHVLRVPNRSGILFHAANEQHETKGCIIPVTTVGRDDGKPRIGCHGHDSGKALLKLEALVPDGPVHELQIIQPAHWNRET